MALAPLASVSDLSDRGVTTGAVSVALGVASAAVRDAAGSAISAATSTVVVNAGNGNLLGLPGPITSVASVQIDAITVPACEYEVLPNGLWRHCGWNSYGFGGFVRQHVPVTVTYTHGLAEVPDDIVDLTCNLAAAWLAEQAARAAGDNPSRAGIQSRSTGIDDATESETYTAEGSAQVSAVFIPEATRNWLAARFGAGVQVVETL